MPHLVPQIAQDVRPVESLHVANLLGVERRQVRVREVERDGDRHRLERHPPLGGEVEARADPGEAGFAELGLELLQDGLKAGARDG